MKAYSFSCDEKDDDDEDNNYYNGTTQAWEWGLRYW